MPQQRQNSKFYSEEAQDILGKLPSWIVLWGMTLIFVIFVGIILGSYFIKYPQVITSQIIITTISPPAELISKMTGRIDTLLYSENDIVRKDDVVAIIYNTASFGDICEVEKILELDDYAISIIDKEYEMGELQGLFSEYRGACRDFTHYQKSLNIPKRLELLKSQISKQNQYFVILEDQKVLIEADLGLTYRQFMRDSTLLVEKLISELEFEKSMQVYLQKRSTLSSFTATLVSTELSVLQMEQQLEELTMQHENETSQYTRQISEIRSRLQAQIKQWRENYLLISPINGSLTLTNFWSAHQNVNVGDKVATVIPRDSMQVIGIMTVPSAGFGRVKVGQDVNIRLNGYPYQEYGVLKGVVSRVSLVPEKDGYIAEVTFPNGLQSTYKTHLSLIQQMDGTGDIITDDQRLIERFIQPLRALFDRAQGN